MPVKVSLDENDSLIVIASCGQLLRREAGWGAERVGELLRQQAIAGILVDSTLVQKQTSPAMSAEMISGFIQAIEVDIPIAYVRPACWTEDYYELVKAAIQDFPVSAHVFDEIDLARDWLRAAIIGKLTSV